MLSWEQVLARRSAAQHLSARLPAGPPEPVVADLCGLHAQVMSSADLALWARMSGAAAEDVPRALTGTRTLVKTWAMRGTLHLLPSDQMPRYLAGLRLNRDHLDQRLLDYHDVTVREIAAVIDAVPVALDGRCLLREELAAEVARITGIGHLEEKLRSGRGGLLKPAARNGHLCFGPSQGRNVTFCRPDQWLHAWHEVEPRAALRDLNTRYLTAYGPATHDDLARWWGIARRAARALLEDLGDDLERVDVEGYKAWDLRGADERMAGRAGTQVVRLLPGFDPHVMGSAQQIRQLLGDRDLRDRVWRKAGWVSPVLLVDGRVQGVWEQKRSARRLEVTVEPFVPLNDEAREQVADETRRLGDFLGTPTTLTYGS